MAGHHLGYGLDDACKPVVVESDLVVAAVEYAVEKFSLEVESCCHALFYGACGNHIHYLDVAALAYAVYACYALLEHGGVPGAVEVDDQRCGLKVKSCAACIGGEEYSGGGVAVEGFHEVASA